MKLTMQLTLDGLIRALRLDAHGLAEEIEGGYRPDTPRRKRDAKPSKHVAMAKGGQENDSARR